MKEDKLFLMPDLIEQFIVDDKGRVGVITDYATKGSGPEDKETTQWLTKVPTMRLEDEVSVVIMVDGHLEAHTVTFANLMLLISRASWPTDEDMRLLS
jgi:hypothetical protein